MNRKILVLETAVFFLIAGAALADTVTVKIQNPGSGSGEVSSSAASSENYPFSGWSGECLGRGQCLLKNLLSGSQKTVIANFNLPPCEFTYSEWGSCQVDGQRYRTIIAISPTSVCEIKENPVISEVCIFPRSCLQTFQMSPEERAYWNTYGPPLEGAGPAEPTKKPGFFDSIKDGFSNGVDAIKNLWGGNRDEAVKDVNDLGKNVIDASAAAGEAIVKYFTPPPQPKLTPAPTEASRETVAIGGSGNNIYLFVPNKSDLDIIANSIFGSYSPSVPTDRVTIIGGSDGYNYFFPSVPTYIYKEALPPKSTDYFVLNPEPTDYVLRQEFLKQPCSSFSCLPSVPDIKLPERGTPPPIEVGPAVPEHPGLPEGPAEIPFEPFPITPPEYTPFPPDYFRDLPPSC